jgi:capsular polysaccharide biosynthesis protein
MTLLGAFRVLLASWAVMVPGLMLSVVVAAVAFAAVPDVYTSSGVAVLVPAKQAGSNGANPLLNFDGSLNTTATLLIQSLNDPGLVATVAANDGDSYTVSNSGNTTADDLGDRPFIYVTTKSHTAAGSTALVSSLLGMAKQDLRDRQRTMHVLPFHYIELEAVNYPSTPKRVIATKGVAAGGAFLLGLALTVGLALWRHAIRTRRLQASASPQLPAGWQRQPAADGRPPAPTSAPTSASSLPALPRPSSFPVHPQPSPLPAPARSSSPGAALVRFGAPRRDRGPGLGNDQI